ncbi:MAG: ATP-binding protein [Pseudomonadota bacterium]
MDDRKNKLKGISLQRNLNHSIMLVCGLFALLASLASGFATFIEAEEAQDVYLQQIAMLLKTGVIHESINVPGAEEASIIIQCLQKSCTAHLAISNDYSDGFHTVILGDIKWRVLLFSDLASSRFAIAQKTELRDELAMDSSLRSFWSILLLAILLILILRLVINNNFKPLQQLSIKIDQRLDTDLTLLPTQKIPQEIIPFVHSINQLLHRVDTVLTQQKRFVSDAAHELRTPLTALSLLADNIQQADGKEQIQQRLLPLQTAINRMRVLVNQLLSLARMQGKPPSKPQLIHLPGLLKEIVASLYPLAEAKSIDLGIVQQQEISLLDSEEGLSIIFHNALDNAIRYSPRDGQIDVSLFIENKYAIFQVLDSGPGIAGKHLEKVFQPFYRANNTEPGNGLGLTICLEIAKRLGGTISLHSQPQGGLLFRYQQKLS